LATGLGPAKVWDAETGKELATLGSHSPFIAWSADGKRLATGGPVKVWDVETGKELLSLDGLQVGGIAWSPDGKRLAMENGDYPLRPNGGTVKVWDADTGKELLTLSGLSTLVVKVAWSPDGKRLATGEDPRTAVIAQRRCGTHRRPKKC